MDSEEKTLRDWAEDKFISLLSYETFMKFVLFKYGRSENDEITREEFEEYCSAFNGY